MTARRTEQSVVVALLLLAGCQPAPAKQAKAEAAQAPQPAQGAAGAKQGAAVFEVAYREAANVFEILDNVSGWWPGKTEDEYRDEWKKRYGIGPEDEPRFARYRALRERYREASEGDPGPGGGLFARAKAPDRIAAAFYGAASLEGAYGALGAFMQPADVAELRGFHEAYRPQCGRLLAESEPYRALAAELQARLSQAEVTAYAGRVAAFYGVAEAPKLTALYVWWPPVDGIMANSRGPFLLLKYNPEKHRDEARNEVEVPVHELVHAVSARQSEERKQALSKVFLAGCDLGDRVAPVKILEEPMAVAQQKLFLRSVDPEKLDFSRSWYGDPWVSTFAKLLYPQLARAYDGGGRLDETLMRRAARGCEQLKAVARTLAR